MALPSLSGLRSFEAAARLESFKAAAEALHVSATAVSHAVRALESEIGIRLFHRETRRVTLTEEGRRLARTVEEAFGQISQAVDEIRPGTGRRKVTIALSPLMASRWLTPRLTDFWTAFPDVDLQLIQSPAKINPRHLEADIYLAWGSGDWPGLPARRLVEVMTTPVASPAFVQRHGKPGSPEELLSLPFLFHRDASEWMGWFKAVNCPVGALPTGVTFEDANILLKTAVNGLGVSLGWIPIINDELKDGSLIRLFDIETPSIRAYYLISNGMTGKDSITEKISDWIMKEAETG